MTSPAKPKIDYLKRQRHILIDMHVPDFEPEFMRDFDPVRTVELYAKAGADSVMLYCNSMTGLANWPTKVGESHPGLDGRDIVGETIALLHDHDMAACAYYSVNFNNWAYLEHPEWRIVNANPSGAWGERGRSGICCPSNRDFHTFAAAQVEELVGGYEPDALFLDMMFWPDVCLCESCRQRYKDEEAAEVPDAIDWWSPSWCRFQATRERWLTEEYRTLAEASRKHRDIPVFPNSSLLTSSWLAGFSHELTTESDLIGGDVHSGLFLYAQLANRLSPTVFQYMHTASGYTTGAAHTATVEEQLSQAHVATAMGGQYMAIDAVQPDGGVYPGTYDLLADVFAQMRPYEEFLGGQAIADVAVYWSADAQMDFDSNGKGLKDAPMVFTPGPHLRSATGACDALQRAHIPVGVITRSQLSSLDSYPVIVLPNVLRMDEEEMAAFRHYVERGGRLYASGYTSLVTTAGVKQSDFGLADVFGCHFEDREAVPGYIRPIVDGATDSIAPARVVGHGTGNPLKAAPWAMTLRVTADDDVATVATRTRRYGDGPGTKTDGWAAIFTDPPWKDTDLPVIVRRQHGAGEVTYSACDIESTIAVNRGSERLFVYLIRALLGRPPTVEADAHPRVWITAFDDAAERRMRVTLFHREPDDPPLPVAPFTLRLTPPEGSAFTGLSRVPDGDPVAFTLDDDGRLVAEIDDLRVFEMLSAAYTR